MAAVISICGSNAKSKPVAESLASRRVKRPRRDDDAMFLVLRNAPDGRFEPYRDFTEPRRRAMADPRNLVNGGESIAWFERAGDPASLRFAPGDRILTGIAEYGSNVIAYLHQADRHGVQVEYVPDDENGQLSVDASKLS